MINDERMVAFINSFDKGNTSFLNQIEKEARADAVPIIRTEIQTLLRFLMAAHRPMEILEVGTAVGFSALLMQEYAPAGAHVTTIENTKNVSPSPGRILSGQERKMPSPSCVVMLRKY